MARLQDPISILKGIGPAKCKLFEQLNIHTLEDLICHFPRGYQDRTAIKLISELQPGEPACFRGTVMNTPRTAHIRSGLDMTKVQVADHSARINLTFFNRKFTADQLVYGKEYVFYGALNEEYGGMQMTNPAFESVDAAPISTRCILPVYPLTAGLTNGVIQKAVAQALAICDPPKEIIPKWIRDRYGILPSEDAYRFIHSPKNMNEADQAKTRMIFEEFFVFSAGLALMRSAREGVSIPAYSDVELTPFLERLPFRLTGAQSRAIADIVEDLQKGTLMNRLVQGDVGSGKTMIAAAAAWLAVRNGYQAAMMAPTEILAEQHYATLDRLLTPLGVRVALLKGSLKEKDKVFLRHEIAEGNVDLVVGTHALVTDSTAFHHLGLVITDEQHRFGVAQRTALAKKGQAVHTLVMSATPIPRTLAILMYGDLDVSIVDELPPGRKNVDTFLVGESYRQRINAFIRKQVEEGHQCFIVCPAVEENEELDLTSAIVWSETLQKTVFPDLRIMLLHGQMKGSEKESIMDAFSKGEADILVATTVIEVGVDVPNATIIIIEDADRFGLSQLHQLRGRVGRGSDQSYCILVSNNKNPETRARLKALCATNDGFKIAEEDLKLRGPGDFFGSRQSGLPTFRVADLSCDLKTMKEAQEASAQWIDSQAYRDSEEGKCLFQRIGTLFANSDISIN